MWKVIKTKMQHEPDILKIGIQVSFSYVEEYVF